jgi:hypothetical protein
MIREILSPLQSGTIKIVNAEFTHQLEHELIYAKEVMDKMANELEFRKNIIESLDGNMPTVLGDEAACACVEQTNETLSAYEQFKKDTEV